MPAGSDLPATAAPSAPLRAAARAGARPPASRKPGHRPARADRADAHRADAARQLSPPDSKIDTEAPPTVGGARLQEGPLRSPPLGAPCRPERQCGRPWCSPSCARSVGGGGLRFVTPAAASLATALPTPRRTRPAGRHRESKSIVSAAVRQIGRGGSCAGSCAARQAMAQGAGGHAGADGCWMPTANNTSHLLPCRLAAALAATVVPSGEPVCFLEAVGSATSVRRTGAAAPGPCDTTCCLQLAPSLAAQACQHAPLACAGGHGVPTGDHRG